MPKAAANYRAACKARSRAEFIAKIGIAEEEADEAQFWLKLICDVLVPFRQVRIEEAVARATITCRGVRASSGYPAHCRIWKGTKAWNHNAVIRIARA